MYQDTPTLIQSSNFKGTTHFQQLQLKVTRLSNLWAKVTEERTRTTQHVCKNISDDKVHQPRGQSSKSVVQNYVLHIWVFHRIPDIMQAPAVV